MRQNLREYLGQTEIKDGFGNIYLEPRNDLRILYTIKRLQSVNSLSNAKLRLSKGPHSLHVVTNVDRM